ncbi:MAG: CBS domain-containing protein [bacterium]
MSTASLMTDFELFKRIAKADYEHLLQSEEIDTTERIKQLILIQSIEGHAHNGHALFHKLRFVDVDTSDTVKALELNADKIKAERQRLIDDIVDFVDDYINGKPRDRLINREGNPLLEIPIFNNLKVDVRSIVRGIYLGGMRDTIEVRKVVEKRYGITIGGGELYTIDIEVMRGMGLNSETLATEDNETKIDGFKKRGLIVNRPPDDDRYRYRYIRHWRGPGQSDDACVLSAGLLWGLSTALGVFLVDAIDTLEKYATSYEDKDKIVAKYIKEKVPDIIGDDEDLYLLAFLCAIPEGMEESYPDSSLRYFLKKDKRTGMSLLRSHINFIQGKPFISVNTFPKPIGVEDFYDHIKNNVLRERKIKIPVTAQLNGLTPPVSSIVSKNYLVVHEDMNVANLARELGKKRYDIAIVLDKDGNIKGIVKAKDLLAYIDILERKIE